MSALIGQIRQLGLVVRDAEQAMQEWARLGVGPFFVMRTTFDDFQYRGRPSPAPDVTMCFSHSGPLQLELIQQHNDVPSAYRDFLESGRQGMQHVSSWFGDHESYDGKRQELLERGFVLMQEGGSRVADCRFAYFETAEPGGLMIEISEAMMPAIADNYQMMVRASRDWDGDAVVAPWQF